MSYQLKKKGFTIIEVLVVIAIIGALGALAISGYTQYRKSTLLDLAGDNLVSQVSEQRSQVIYGQNDEQRFESIKEGLTSGNVVGSVAETGTPCRGLYFEKNEQGFDVFSFKREFLNKKIFDNERGWIYAGCAVFDPNRVELRPLEKDKEVVLSGAYYGDGAGEISDSFYFQFAPLSGEVSTNLSGDSVELLLQYGFDQAFQKKVLINLK